MTVPVVLAIAGVVALLVGVLGGGIRAKEIEIRPIPAAARVLASLGGLVLVGLAVWLSSPGPLARAIPAASLEPTPATAAPAPAATATSSSAPMSAAAPIASPAAVAATETPVPLAAAIRAGAPASATATPAAAADPSTPPDVFVEDFSRGSRYWETGVTDNDYTTSSLSLADGALRWQVTAKQDVSTGMEPRLPALSDFDLETTLKLVSASGSLAYGVRFRANDAGAYYFVISRTGAFVLNKWSEEEEEYTRLVTWTESTAIDLDGENTLRVRAVGNKIRLYINDTLVSDYVDSSFATGEISIDAWLSAGEKLTLDVTSFKVSLLSP